MNNTLRALSFSLTVVLLWTHPVEARYIGPGQSNPLLNSDTFSTYCVNSGNPLTTAYPNYSNQEIIRAAKSLSGVEPNALYFYAGSSKAIGLQKRYYDVYKDKDKNIFIWIREGVKINSKLKKRLDAGALTQLAKRKPLWYRPHTKLPLGISNTADSFLTQLCTEFRDRASLIQNKVRWVSSLVKLPPSPQKAIDFSKPLWPQVSAHSYKPFLKLSSQVWRAKRAELIKEKRSKLSIGGYGVDAPVPATTVCETKFMFSTYIVNNKTFKDLDSYRRAYQKFYSSCSDSDLKYYFVYRGDSNLKAFSPESNAMIWYANSLALHCRNVARAIPGSAVSDADCKSYFSKPFSNRWNAARASLAVWLFHDQKYDADFSNVNKELFIFPNADGASRPYSFGFTKSRSNGLSRFMNRWMALNDAWSESDIGFNSLAALGGQTATADKGKGSSWAYERLRDAVNRHTDWYHSGYNDGRGFIRYKAYSPFVASSYEPSISDKFASPGYTVGGDSDGRKCWMFVFRVKKENWYNAESLAQGRKIDFDRMWLDERSLGTDPYAKSERAFDRLGSALEGELAAILYLHNIKDDGTVSADTGVPYVVEK